MLGISRALSHAVSPVVVQNFQRDTRHKQHGYHLLEHRPRLHVRPLPPRGRCHTFHIHLSRCSCDRCPRHSRPPRLGIGHSLPHSGPVLSPGRLSPRAGPVVAGAAEDQQTACFCAPPGRRRGGPWPGVSEACVGGSGGKSSGSRGFDLRTSVHKVGCQRGGTLLYLCERHFQSLCQKISSRGRLSHLSYTGRPEGRKVLPVGLWALFRCECVYGRGGLDQRHLWQVCRAYLC